MYRYGLVLCYILLASCNARNSASPVEAAGDPKTAKTATLETGASLLQSKAPLDSLNIYLNGFHFYSGNMQGQMEAHHYCSALNEDTDQCVIYDGNRGDAKLMGIEYVISRKLYDQLPAEERKLWHSHVHEVKSGQLIAPGIPEAAENELMKKLVGTYGKTWHTWHTDRQHTLPLGQPLLMMGFTADGQASAQMVADRDRRFNMATLDKKKSRAGIRTPAIHPDADSWKRGDPIQLTIGPASKSAAHSTKPQAAK